MNFIQKGGISFRAGYDEESAAIFFIQNSTCDIISYKTKGGIIFKLTLNRGITSPYSDSRSIDTNKSINQIILKLVFLHESKNFVLSDKVIYNNQTDIDFTNEVEIQKDVYSKSFGVDLEPICPSIAFSKIFIETNTTEYLTDLLSIASTVQKCNTIIERLITQISDFKIGVIMMELLDGFSNLTDYIQVRLLYQKRIPTSPTQTYYLDLALFELYLLYNIGYIHGDITLANLMLNRKYQYLDRQHPGRVIIIDFGATFLHSLTEKILPDNIVRVAELCRTIGSPFYGSIADEQASTWPSYDWLDYYKENKDESNIRLNEIYNMRQAQKMRFHESILLNERNYLKKDEIILGVTEKPHIPTISAMNIDSSSDDSGVVSTAVIIPPIYGQIWRQPPASEPVINTSAASNLLANTSVVQPVFGQHVFGQPA